MHRVSLVILILAFTISPLGRGDAADRLVTIPDSLLPASIRSEVKEVIEGAAFEGEKKDVVFKGHRVVFEYLLNHLDFTSQLARILKLSDYAIEQTGEGTYEATTPKGGWAHLQVVYADGNKRVVLAQGRYGRAVVVLQYASFDRGGDSYMVNDLYGYVRADNPILNFLLALFGGVLDHRVARIFASVAELSERAYEAPTSFSQELFTHEELPPGQVLEFAKILERVPGHDVKTRALLPRRLSALRRSEAKKDFPSE
jgi:hypothetical protein